MTYTEMLGTSHLHPHRFPALRPDGEVEPLRLICLPNHISIDTGMARTAVRSQYIIDNYPDFRKVGGALQIMNHPDIHIDDLESLVGRIPSDRRADWTASEIADWWRSSHSADSITVQRVDTDRYRVRSLEGVKDLVLEILRADGSEARRTVTIGAGGEAIADFGEPGSKPI